MTAALWSLVLLCLVLRTAAQDSGRRGLPPQSPCPSVYSYGWDPSQGWYGIITILPPARFSEIQLVLRLTVPYYKPELGVGRVEVKGGTREIQAISYRANRGERRQIQYLVIFPAFDEVPRMKELYINGYSFCKATEAVGSRSTIELKYVLKSGLNLPLASGSEFSIVNTNKPSNPSRPDVITIAIIDIVEEARPMPTSEQQPAQIETHRPCDIPIRAPMTELNVSYEADAPPHNKPVDNHTPGPINNNPPKVDVDDKIHLTNSTIKSKDESSRVVPLLESLVHISKKRYQVELERLLIEKERLLLEKLPHAIQK